MIEVPRLQSVSQVAELLLRLVPQAEGRAATPWRLPEVRTGRSNKGMKLAKLVAAPDRAYKAPPRAFRRFAAARTASQLIPGVRRTRR